MAKISYKDRENEKSEKKMDFRDKRKPIFNCKEVNYEKNISISIQL